MLRCAGERVDRGVSHCETRSRTGDVLETTQSCWGCRRENLKGDQKLAKLIQIYTSEKHLRCAWRAHDWDERVAQPVGPYNSQHRGPAHDQLEITDRVYGELEWGDAGM